MGKLNGKRGLDKGQRHAGQFKAGHDSRRHVEGRNKYKQGIESLCRIHTENNLNVLSRIINDDEHPTGERIRAIELMLAHGHGKPVDRVAIQTLSSDNQAPSDMSTDALIQAVMASLPPQGDLKQEGSVGYLDHEEIDNNFEVLDHPEILENSEVLDD